MTKSCLLCGKMWSGKPDELLCLIESNIGSVLEGLATPVVAKPSDEVMACQDFFARVHDETKPALSPELLKRVPGLVENPQAAYVEMFYRAFSLAMSIR